MPNALKIAVYTMAKNEIDHVERFVETTKEADVVFVTDTGSTDGTQEALRDGGVTVHDARIMPWRFDHATNAALHNVPGDIDVCIKLDLDEVIFMTDGGSWREEIERLWIDKVNQLMYWYTWSWIKRGVTPGTRFKTGCVHARSGFHWKHPGHAALTCMDEIHKVDAEKFEIHHYMVNKGRPDYIHLLELAEKENRCPRTLFYLGREYHYRKRDQDAINMLMDYLDHPDSKWDAERAAAMHMIGRSWERFGKHDRALEWLLRSTGEFPECRDLWFEVLRFFHDRSDFAGGYWAGLKCLAISNRRPTWVGQIEGAWTEAPYAYTAQCAQHIGQTVLANKFSKAALEMNPDNQMAKQLQLVIV